MVFFRHWVSDKISSRFFSDGNSELFHSFYFKEVEEKTFGLCLPSLVAL